MDAKLRCRQSAGEFVQDPALSVHTVNICTGKQTRNNRPGPVDFDKEGSKR